MLWHAQLAEAVPEAGRVGSLWRMSLHDDVLPGEPTDFPVCACFPIFGVGVYGNPTPWRLISQWKRWNPAVPENAPEAGSGRMPLDSSNRRKLPRNPGSSPADGRFARDLPRQPWESTQIRAGYGGKPVSGGTDGRRCAHVWAQRSSTRAVEERTTRWAGNTSLHFDGVCPSIRSRVLRAAERAMSIGSWRMVVSPTSCA